MILVFSCVLFFWHINSQYNLYIAVVVVLSSAMNFFFVVFFSRCCFLAVLLADLRCLIWIFYEMVKYFFWLRFKYTEVQHSVCLIVWFAQESWLFGFRMCFSIRFFALICLWFSFSVLLIRLDWCLFFGCLLFVFYLGCRFFGLLGVYVCIYILLCAYESPEHALP